MPFSLFRLLGCHITPSLSELFVLFALFARFGAPYRC
jgi:hypothetical protein